MSLRTLVMNHFSMTVKSDQRLHTKKREMMDDFKKVKMRRYISADREKHINRMRAEKRS